MSPGKIALICSGLLASTLVLNSCGVRKKETSRKLETSTFKDSIGQSSYHAQLIREEFGGVLNGSFSINDSTDQDSTEFESDGLKVKVKLSRTKPGGDGKPGKTKVDIQANAKPTARSTLTINQDSKGKVTQGAKSTLAEETKITVNRLPIWIGFAIVLMIIGVIVILVQKAKKNLK